MEKTQEQSVLEHLRKEGPITPLQALKLYGCFRLAAVIHKLKGEGHNIKTETATSPSGKKKFALYTLQF